MWHRLAVSAVIAAAAGALGCGRGGGSPAIEASVTVTGPVAEVVVHRVREGDVVTVDGRSRTADARSGALVFELPTDRFEDGATIEVTRTRAGAMARMSLGAEVTDEDREPRLVLWRCTDDPASAPVHGSDDRRATIGVWITSDAWLVKSTARPRELCVVHADGRARLPVAAHSDATVTIAERPVALVDGRGEHVIDLASLVPALSLAELEADGDRRDEARTVTVDAIVTRAGRSRTYALDVELEREDVRVAMHRAFTSWDGKAAWPWPRTPHVGPARGAALVTHDLAVDVDGAPRRTMNGWYAFPRVVGGAARLDEVDLVAIATPVGATNAGSCRYTTTEGVGPVRNVMYKVGLEVVVRDATGAEVARRTWPAPKQLDCPDALASRDDRTRLLVTTPRPEPILAWLDELRAAR